MKSSGDRRGLGDLERLSWCTEGLDVIVVM